MNGFKKFLNVILIIIGVALIVVCGDLVTNKVVNNTFEQLDEVDQTAVEDVCEVVSLFDSRKGNKDIWNTNYNPRKIGCVIFGDGRTYAVNVDLSGIASAQKIELPDKFSDISVYRFSHLSPTTFSLRSESNDNKYIHIKGKNILCIKYTENSANLNGAGSLKENYVKSTFNEALESPDCPTAEVTVSFDMSVENIALTGLQYRIIDDMRSAGSKKELNELISEYVIIRDYQAELSPEFAEQQQRIELVQGRPQFVFYKISDLTGDDMTYFNKSKAEAINFYSAYHYLCTGKYNDDIYDYLNRKGNIYIGAVLCEILDNNRIATDWEFRLDNSSNSDFRSQYTLIKKYCRKNCGEFTKEKTVDSIKEAYNYEEITAMASALVKGNAAEEQ